jgi:hypothetical protein
MYRNLTQEYPRVRTGLALGLVLLYGWESLCHLADDFFTLMFFGVLPATAISLRDGIFGMLVVLAFLCFWFPKVGFVLFLICLGVVLVVCVIQVSSGLSTIGDCLPLVPAIASALLLNDRNRFNGWWAISRRQL